jgi:hypothetical protein
MSWFDEEIAMETASDSPSSWLGDINANLGGRSDRGDRDGIH